MGPPTPAQLARFDRMLAWGERLQELAKLEPGQGREFWALAIELANEDTQKMRTLSAYRVTEESLRELTELSEGFAMALSWKQLDVAQLYHKKFLRNALDVRLNPRPNAGANNNKPLHW